MKTENFFVDFNVFFERVYIFGRKMYMDYDFLRIEIVFICPE